MRMRMRICDRSEAASRCDILGRNHGMHQGGVAFREQRTLEAPVPS